MAWNFCAYCGTAVNWPPAMAAARLELRQRCRGCGNELYRNPEVRLLCMAHQDGEGRIDWTVGQLRDHEIVQEAVLRLLSGYRFAAGVAAGPRLLAMVTDLDADCVYLIFRAHVTRSLQGTAPVEMLPWIQHIEALSSTVLGSNDRRVHSGIVHDHRLQFTS